MLFPTPSAARASGAPSARARPRRASAYARSAILLAAVLALRSEPAPAEEARGVVLMIGDGMGFEHVRAASLYLYGREGTLAMECLPSGASVGTRNASGDVTDSAAAGTALATGRKVANGVLSVAIPGDGSKLETLVEIFRKDGRRTGLVTTTRVVDATPAAFGAHAASRKDCEAIARSMFGDVRPDLVLGAAEDEPDIALAVEAGYRLERSLARLGREGAVLGAFAAGALPYEYDLPAAGARAGPVLAEMTRAALEFLGGSGAGFFLMVEGARIDHASHSNDLARAVGEVAGFDRAVEAVLRWAGLRRDLLLVVTADHETGGLAVARSRGRGELPEVRWSSKKHTAADVPLFAWGAGSWRFAGRLENAEVFEIIVQCAAPAPASRVSPDRSPIPAAREPAGAVPGR